MKKSFILHLDSLVILDKMPDEMAGRFIKLIYHYQTTGELPNIDFAMEMAITPFINQFKRDNESWAEECKANSDKGKLGNLKRWHTDLYNKVINNELSIDEATEIILHRHPIAPNRPQSPPIPKSLDSDSDSDSDNVSDSKSESKKDSKRDRFTPPQLSDVINYFTENGYTEQSATKAFNHYQIANWYDTNGKKVKNWKQKMHSVWFKDENKSQKNKQDIIHPHPNSFPNDYEWWKYATKHNLPHEISQEDVIYYQNLNK